MKLFAEAQHCPWDCGCGSHHPLASMPRLRERPLVLVASDQSEVTSFAHRVLLGAGVEVASCACAQVMETANTLQPNLVLLDIDASAGNGFDLCNAMHTDSTSWRSPVIFVSKPDQLPAKVKALACGAVDYLNKPLEEPETVARVRTHLCLQYAAQRLSELHAEQLKLFGDAQQSCMARPQEMAEARFHVALRQVNYAGGDFYDVLAAGADEFHYIVADASGHDLSASYWTLALKALWAEYSTSRWLQTLFAPMDSFSLINRALVRMLPEGVFFTACSVRLNRRAGTALLVTAGHPPALHVRRNSGDEFVNVVEQSSDVLGAFPDATFGRIELEVEPGDRIFLFSDGLVEVGNSLSAGLRRLTELTSTLSEKPLSEAVDQMVELQLHGYDLKDDVLLMGIEI